MSKVILGIVPAIGIGFFKVDNDELVLQLPFLLFRFCKEES